MTLDCRLSCSHQSTLARCCPFATSKHWDSALISMGASAFIEGKQAKLLETRIFCESEVAHGPLL